MLELKRTCSVTSHGAGGLLLGLSVSARGRSAFWREARHLLLALLPGLLRVAGVHLRGGLVVLLARPRGVAPGEALERTRASLRLHLQVLGLQLAQPLPLLLPLALVHLLNGVVRHLASPLPEGANGARRRQRS